MPRVTIVSRHRTFRSPEPARIDYFAEVQFSIPGLLPRSVLLPEAHYRDATPQEQAAHPDYEVMPKDKAAEDAERQAIQADIARTSSTPLSSFTF